MPGGSVVQIAMVAVKGPKKVIFPKGAKKTGLPFSPGILGDCSLGMIDLRDVADSAAAVLSSDDHLGKTYTLSGPNSITYAQIATEMSSLLGRTITYADVPSETMREGMIGTGMDEWTADVYCGAFEIFKDGFADFVTDDVETLLGRPARTFSEFASDFAEVFGSKPGTA